MKKIISITLAILTLSTIGCAVPKKAYAQRGRIIEFKSDANGFDTKTYFYEGENEVVAFDAQFTAELARQSILHLRKYTNKPITWLVITHPNPDKFNGASVFKQEGAKILASKSTAESIPGTHAYKEFYFVEIAKMFKKGEYPQPVPVDQVFTQTLDLVLGGGEHIEIRELLNPGVSSSQTVAYIKSVGALFVGDLIHNKAHAWLEGGITNGKPTPTIEGWISDLKELEILYPANTRVFGGRGVSADLNLSVKNEINYLLGAVQLIDAYLKSLGGKVIEFNGPNAGLLYKALSAKFQEKFPDYDLPYMIEYGAYGLVQSELQKMK